MVNPLIDTYKLRFDYFALSPKTSHGDLWNSGYIYDDEHILNFSHRHNAQTAGNTVMLVTGFCKGNFGIEARKSLFLHEKEIVKPGSHKEDAYLVSQRYWVESSFDNAKNELGMSDYQIRKW